MDAVRLNTAHMTHDDALEVIENTRKVSDKIGIIIDTKGPEIRTCDTEEPMKVEYENYIRLKGDPSKKSTGKVIYTSYENFVDG